MNNYNQSKSKILNVLILIFTFDLFDCWLGCFPEVFLLCFRCHWTVIKLRDLGLSLKWFEIKYYVTFYFAEGDVSGVEVSPVDFLLIGLYLKHWRNFNHSVYPWRFSYWFNFFFFYFFNLFKETASKFRSFNLCYWSLNYLLFWFFIFGFILVFIFAQTF